MTMMILFASTKNMIVSSCTAKHHIKFIYFHQLKICNSLVLLIYLRYSLTIHAFAFFLKLILLQYIEGEKMTIQLLADSACDLPQSLADQYGIQIVPLTVHLDQTDYKDRQTIDPKK